MKHLLMIFLSFLLCFQSLAECDWKTIQEVDSKFVYTKECHLKVADLVKNEKFRTEQVAELNKAIDLKDLALDKADQRVILWRAETYKQNDALEKAYKVSELTKWLYFGLGIVGTSLAVMGAGQLR